MFNKEWVLNYNELFSVYSFSPSSINQFPFLDFFLQFRPFSPHLPLGRLYKINFLFLAILYNIIAPFYWLNFNEAPLYDWK